MPARPLLRRFALAASIALAAPVRAPAEGERPAAPPAAVPDEAAKAGAEPDTTPIPPGSPADQALWRNAGSVSREITAVRTASSALQWRIHSLDLVARLGRSAKAAGADEAKRLEALRERLIAAQAENYAILTSRWPVDPTRGCQYPQLMLGSAMQAGEGADNRVLLAQAREETQACVDAASRATARLTGSNQALSAAVDDVVKALPWPAPPPASAAPAGAQAPVPAAVPSSGPGAVPAAEPPAPRG